MTWSWILLLTASLVCSATSIGPGGILNASGGQSHLAPNALFVIYGYDLGPPSIAVAPPPRYPLELSGTSITFTPVTGGEAIHALVFYTIDSQVGGLVPSTVKPGMYAVRVTYQGETSAPQEVAVFSRSFGIATANGAGTGVTQATIFGVHGGYNLTRFTSLGSSGEFVHTPAHPGDTISLYGTGGGADLANDTGGSSGDQTAAGNFFVRVGNRAVTPLYAGTVAGYPGLWMVNLTLPKDIAPDCFTLLSVWVYDNHENGNVAVLPIAAPGQLDCSDPAFSQSQLARLDAEDSLIEGKFTLSAITKTILSATKAPTIQIVDDASGSFARFSVGAYAGRKAPGLRVDACEAFITERVLAPASTESFSFMDTRPSAWLNAGPALRLAGPRLDPAASLPGQFPTIYDLHLAPGSIEGGSYTLSGAGGLDIGAFQASVAVPQSFAVTDWEKLTTVRRDQPLVLRWTGGGTGYVSATLASSKLSYESMFCVDDNPYATCTDEIAHTETVTLECRVPATQGVLTIASSLLHILPGVGLDTNDGTATSLWVRAESDSTFTGNLIGGGQADFASLGYSIGVASNPAIQ